MAQKRQNDCEKRLYVFDRETGCDFFSVENAVSCQNLCASTISNCDFQKLHRKNDCDGLFSTDKASVLFTRKHHFTFLKNFPAMFSSKDGDCEFR